jgi:adenylate cyclase
MSTVKICTVGVVLAYLHVLLAYGFSNVNAWYNASIVAVLCGLLISLIEVYLFRRLLRKMKFLWVFLIRIGLYLFSLSSILFHVSLFSRMYRFQFGYQEVLQSDEFKLYLTDSRFLREVVFITIFALIIYFTRMMNRKMGQGMLWDYITGKYYRPKLESQVFLFLRVRNSIECLKKMGHFKYHEFLNQFYYGISESILQNGGVIHEYVEDLVVVRWDVNHSGAMLGGLNTFLSISKGLDKMKTDYHVAYNFTPEIEAAIHQGHVVGTEIGELKTQIVFHGDTLNTTSRILDQCKALGFKLLISSDYKKLVEKYDTSNFEPAGNIELKGKIIPISLYGLSNIEAK